MSKNRKKALWKVFLKRTIPGKYLWPIKQFIEKSIGKILRIFGKDLNYFYGEYFATSALRSKEWAQDYCDVISRMFSPASIIDFGCGTGDILAGF